MAGPSSPYYRFGYQSQRSASRWSNAAGGIPHGRLAGESRALGLVQLDESGLTPYSMHYPPLQDWPALRPAGPEPLDRRRALGLSPGEFFAGMGLAQLAILGVVGYLGWRLLRPKKRKNPAHRPKYMAPPGVPVRRPVRMNPIRGGRKMLANNRWWRVTDYDGTGEKAKLRQAIDDWLQVATPAEIRKNWRRHWGPMPAWAKK